jgi:DNA-binding transcriptional regulator YiaG
MIDICLKNKIIYGFLKNYKHKKWNNIIPSLLEIAILNLYSSFNRYIFSEEDFSLIILNLKSKNNIPLEKEQYFKNKKINNKREKLNLDIPEFRRNFKLNSQDCLKLRNESYRSFSNKPKNINELNIYSNNTKDNKRIHFYNRSSVVTPIKKLINYNEMDLSIGDNNKSTNIYKLYNKRKSKNSFKFNYNNNKKIIDYNTVDRCKYTDKYENVFNSHKSLYINRNMNFSHSIDYKKDKDKNYINVNINDNSSNKKYDKNINEEGKIMKKNSEFLTKKIKEIRNKTNLINKIGKLKEINEKRKKQKNILTSFNKE